MNLQGSVLSAALHEIILTIALQIEKGSQVTMINSKLCLFRDNWLGMKRNA